MKRWGGVLVVLALAGCQPSPPEPSVEITPSQVAVGQAWQKLETQSLYAPRVASLDPQKVQSIFWDLLDPGQKVWTLPQRKRVFAGVDFPALARGERFEVLEALVPQVDKPLEAARWHVYGAWINAVARSFDERALFYPPSRTEAAQTMVTAREDGVGIELSTTPQGVMISTLAPQGPARKAGVPEGALIMAVAEGSGKWMDVSRKTAFEVASLLRGPSGTRVRLKTKKGTTEREWRIRRDQWHLDAMRVSYFYSGDRIVVSVPYFYTDQDPAGRWSFSTEQDVSAALAQARGRKVILDLRGNPGGVLEQAEQVGKILYLEPGAWVVQTHFQTPGLHPVSKSNVLPTQIWVNETTGSSAEVLAGALQQRGVPVVGKPTFGKSTMQTFVPLDHRSFMHAGQSNTGSLLFTTAQVVWATPRQERIAPDCLVEAGTQEDYLRVSRSCFAMRTGTGK